jgi:hypothetical protein
MTLRCPSQINLRTLRSQPSLVYHLLDGLNYFLVHSQSLGGPATSPPVHLCGAVPVDLCSNSSVLHFATVKATSYSRPFSSTHARCPHSLPFDQARLPPLRKTLFRS